ncbi:MAG TPA: nitroreductase family protein [Clostridiaceae bacterium]
MDFLELAKRRYSSRKYKSLPVEMEKLAKILEAGRVAPTGANTQPQRIIVVREAAGLEKLKKGANIHGAPLGLIICGDHKASWKRPYDGKDILELDSAIVTTHMVMEATDLELDSIWVCYFDPEIIKTEFKIPDNYEALSIIGIGYGDGPKASPDRHDKARKPLEDTVFYESF